ncbi:MAG: aldehyde dehydrogenase family protein, partial [Lacipirellulaceae bacterium]
MGAHGSSIKNLPVSKDVQAYIESGIEKDLFKNRAGSNFHEVINPASGEVMLSVPDSTETEVDRVISNARQQVDSGDWARWSPYQRQSALMRLADLIEKNADFLAELEMVNTGKLRRVARNIEVGASVEYVQYMAGWPTRIGGETLPTSIPAPEGKRWQAHTNREPIGVVGAITPWNFPFMMAIWKIIPALACGNSVVIKPSELAPLTTFKLIELIQEAGIPEGVVGLVTGGA